MNIQSVNCQHPQTAFKSAYPVVHWVRETNGSFAPAVSEELNRRLQRTLVRLLNNQGKNISQSNILLRDYVQKVVKASDKDYAKTAAARSFYNGKGGWKSGRFEPLGYILTGSNALHMNESFGKPIGRAKRDIVGMGRRSAEVNIALGDYWMCGLKLVKQLASKFRDEKNIRSALHTKFEIVRSKNGNIKEFRLLDLRFCPEEGAENPFVRTGYINLKK